MERNDHWRREDSADPVTLSAKRLDLGTAMDIGGWLRGLGLERYEQAFRENEIDLRVLLELTADDLKWNTPRNTWRSCSSTPRNWSGMIEPTRNGCGDHRGRCCL